MTSRLLLKNKKINKTISVLFVCCISLYVFRQDMLICYMYLFNESGLSKSKITLSHLAEHLALSYSPQIYKEMPAMSPNLLY